LSINPISYQDLLIGVNIAIYVAAGVGVIWERKHRIPDVHTLDQALAILEKSLRRTFPDLPEGFTWQEVVTRLKAKHLKANWDEIENIMRRYEEYRFGGKEMALHGVSPRSVVKLAYRLPKGERFVTRSKEKSA
jgi:hypothetical protein